MLGSGLAVRIAALLLARKGRRILVLQDEGEEVLPPQLPCTRHMTRLLAALGGEAGDLPTTASPWQVIAPRQRIDFGAEFSLEEECGREFPASAKVLCDLFGNLKQRGAALEQALADRSPSPLLYRRSQLRLAVATWRPQDGPPPGRSLMALLKRLPDAVARNVMADLFAGLALQSASTLSIAEAALLWHWATLPEAVGSHQVAELLEKRIGQFYVFTLPLAELQTLESSGKHLAAVVLKNGQRMSGRLFVLHAPAALHCLPQSSRLGAVPPVPGRRLWRTSPVRGTLSARLAPQVVLTGAPPLRLQRQPGQSEPVIQVACGLSGAGPPPSAPQVSERLTALLPFTSFTLEAEPSPVMPEVSYRTATFRPAGLRCLAPRGNLIYAHPAWCGPTTGMEGSATLGFALADGIRHLLGQAP